MVAARLLQLLALLAMVLAPLGMAAGHGAMIAPVAHEMTAMGSDHCVGMDQPAKPQPASCLDCNMVCAGLLAANGQIAVHPIAAAPLPRTPLEDALTGRLPESDPPPPRFA